MNESVRDFNVPENVIATPGSNIYVIREVVNQAVECASVIENTDDDILKITSAVLEKVDITDQDITMTENLVATLDSSTKGIREIVDQIAEAKIENRKATFIPNTEGIPEIVDQEAGGIDAIGNLVATPGPSVEGVSENMDQTVEDLKVTENLKVAPVSGTEVFTEMMDLDEVSDTESFVTASGLSPERINETMYETTEDINVTEKVFSTLGSNTYTIKEVMNQAVVGTSVIENIDDDIMEITSVPSTEAVLVDITDQDITMTENLVVTPDPSTKGNREIVDQEVEGIGAIENLVATPGPSLDGVGETMDQTVEDLKVTENLKIAPASGTEVFTETMDLDEVSDTESFVTAPGSVPEGINEIVDQEAEGADANGNFVSTPGPSVEEVSKEMYETVEDFKVTENLKSASASHTEVFTEIMDPDEVSVTESLVAAAESTTERINEITEDISMRENIEVIPLPDTERISEINDKIAESFGLTENLEAIPVSSTGVSETHVQNENTTNIGLNKDMSNTENETGSETSKTMESADKSLKTESKIKSLKRKTAHPPISEMLMGSIKSLKKSSGVSFEDIKTQMEKNYPVNVKALVKYHVINYLKKWVEMGILEKVDGERFIIKESEISYENDCIIQAKKLKIN